MTINRYNYELFLVDYLDGKLNPSLASEFLVFLEKNQDIKNELEGIEDAVLVAENIPFPNKLDLKKKSLPIYGIDDELEYLYIASVEGVLSKDEQLKLDSELSQSEEKKRTLAIFKKTTLQPDQNIIFPEKLQLKRTRIVPIRYSYYRRTLLIAASIGLILGVYTISKLMVNEKSNPLIRERNTVAFQNLPKKSKATKIKIDNNILDKISLQKRQNIAETAIESKNTETISSTEIKQNVELVPLAMLSIESKNVTIQKNIQYEQVALQIEDYSRHRDFANKYLRSRENMVAKSNYREIGVFEIIQYGVQSFGRLIGKDIKLKAKKDKNGRIENISFESGLFAFSTQIRKKE